MPTKSGEWLKKSQLTDTMEFYATFQKMCTDHFKTVNVVSEQTRANAAKTKPGAAPVTDVVCWGSCRALGKG